AVPLMNSAMANGRQAEQRRTGRKPQSLGKIKSAARKLFLERGYDATRPQDIAREAGLGHGTFYLHYPDKRACFLAFVEEARAEMDGHLRAARHPDHTMQEAIEATLTAIYDYSGSHPGVLRAALTDAAVIDANSGPDISITARWGVEWADIIESAAARGRVSRAYHPGIIGQAIAGALHQAARECARSRQCRKMLADNLTRFVLRALRPD
ncbi:MAG: TetR/AcrR family transcriptional regulator, partial [Rhizomicrobium sp.]